MKKIIEIYAHIPIDNENVYSTIELGDNVTPNGLMVAYEQVIERLDAKLAEKEAKKLYINYLCNQCDGVEQVETEKKNVKIDFDRRCGNCHAPFRSYKLEFGR